MKKFILGALLASMAVVSVPAQQKMYLVKDNHLVATYDVDDVDYVTFNLPGDVSTNPLAVEVKNVGKNTVTYNVTTTERGVAYAHNIYSMHLLNNYAMSYFGEMFADLADEEKSELITDCIYNEGCYVASGSQSFTMKDFESDGFGYMFSVRAGTDYIAVAVPLTDDQEDIVAEQLCYTNFKTADPAATPLAVEAKLVSAANGIVEFDFSGTSTDIKYLMVAVLPSMYLTVYQEYYGLGVDFILDAWGYPYTLEELIEDPTWSISEAGTYTALVRGVDANGDIADANVEFEYVDAAEETDAPAITILSKSKDNGVLNVNFEVSPSNVTEAYYYIDTENNVDDLLNDGWEAWEIATRSAAVDVTDAIHSAGEYTINTPIDSELWNTLLIYAKGSEGGKTVLRVNFHMDADTYWDVQQPIRSQVAKARKLKVKNAKKPVLKHIKK